MNLKNLIYSICFISCLSFVAIFLVFAPNDPEYSYFFNAEIAQLFCLNFLPALILAISVWKFGLTSFSYIGVLILVTGDILLWYIVSTTMKVGASGQEGMIFFFVPVVQVFIIGIFLVILCKRL